MCDCANACCNECECRGGRGRWLAGRFVLVLSGLGFPLTQAVIARFGRKGAVVVEGVAVGLYARDAVLVRSGALARLEPFPAALLRIEMVAASMASLFGLAAVRQPRQRLDRTPAGLLEGLRRFSIGLLFGMHTYRFWIYLQPGSGRSEQYRAAPPAPETAK